MSFDEIDISEDKHFSGYQSNLDYASHVLFGVPHDMTLSYRTGAREGPSKIREASQNIEGMSSFSGRDISELRIHDLGNLSLVGSHSQRLKQVEQCLLEVKKLDKVPIMLGGEHSITISVVDSLPHSSGLVIFDAHSDLREDYLGEHFSHACTTRRLLDKKKPEDILQIGVRATSMDEKEWLEGNPSLTQISSLQVHQQGLEVCAQVIQSFIDQHSSIYVSLDIDCFDPAYAPGTGTPEPMGLSPFQVFSFIHHIPAPKICGIDLVEVSPTHDHGGITSVLAARTLFELLLTKK